MFDVGFLQNGIGFGAVALAANRLALGTFFGISGYHKLFNKQRHATVTNEMRALHIPCVGLNQWWVPGVEFFGGLSLLSGILSPFASMGLIVVCLVACLTAGVRRIPSFNPIDKADWLDDLLYLPETLYIIGLLVILTFGPGPFTIPAIFG